MSERKWIAVIPARAVKTLLIRASSRKEAEHKLNNLLDYPDDIEGIDVSYDQTGVGRVVREDRRLRGTEIRNWGD